jgi:hypothetical protein
MMPDEVLAVVAQKLEEHSIAYMITGSYASNTHGTPRTTNDADIVIEIDNPGIAQLSKAFGDDFYFDMGVAEDAVKKEFMCNAIHYDTGFKIDFIIRKNRAFSRSEFQRRMKVEFAGGKYWFSSPEDTILSKLEWSRKGDSERQFLDAVNVAKVQAKNLDFEYLRHWAAELQVEEQLNNLLQEIEPLK